MKALLYSSAHYSVLTLLVGGFSCVKIPDLYSQLSVQKLTHTVILMVFAYCEILLDLFSGFCFCYPE